MRVLIHGLNFAPELVGVGKFSGEMAEWLAASGHDVLVVTAPPFNPAARVFSGFSAWRYTRESRSYDPAAEAGKPRSIPTTSGPLAASRGVTVTESSPSTGLLVSEAQSNHATSTGSLSVCRCPLWVPRSPSAGKRLVHLVSFALSSSFIMLRQASWRPDVVVVVEPTLFCAPSAWLTARLSGAKSWLHVQDFETDAAFELGLLKSSRLRSMALWLEQKCMRGFDRVSTISEKMLLRLTKKRLDPFRCLLFPNWVDTGTIFPLQTPSCLRGELRIPHDAIVALYSGTMAQKQGLDMLADAVRKLESRPELHFVFCGDGAAKPILAGLAAEMKNVHLLHLQPLERLNDLLNLADIHLLPQRADAADLVMPSKLTGMLASGRPVVASAAIGTQLAQALDGRGIVVPPGDVSAFAWAIGELASHPTLREKLGRNARAYAVSDLDRNVVLRRFEQDLFDLVSTERQRLTLPN
jgi:colanic acid biosynthesis glycosyl transferase WcaI